MAPLLPAVNPSFKFEIPVLMFVNNFPTPPDFRALNPRLIKPMAFAARVVTLPTAAPTQNIIDPLRDWTLVPEALTALMALVLLLPMANPALKFLIPWLKVEAIREGFNAAIPFPIFIKAPAMTLWMDPAAFPIAYIGELLKAATVVVPVPAFTAARTPVIDPVAPELNPSRK